MILGTTIRSEGYDLHISERNDKLGRTMNISLPPGTTCLPDVPCREKCYAMKFYNMRTRVRKAWDDNLALYRADPFRYFDLIRMAIAKKKPLFFRWHVSGDIPDLRYAEGILDIAEVFGATNFLIYTRVPGYLFDAAVQSKCGIPPNLAILESQWLGFDHKPYGTLPTFMVVKPGLTVTTNDPGLTVYHCPGSCPTCRICWSAKRRHIDIITIGIH
jgi:hypothetical protein